MLSCLSLNQLDTARPTFSQFLIKYNPSYNIPEKHKIRGSTDMEALELWKARLGARFEMKYDEGFPSFLVCKWKPIFF